MVWTIEITGTAKKQLSKLDKQTAKRITGFLKGRIGSNPKAFGKGLKGNLNEFWRYRVGDYRIICELNNQHMIILVLQIGHRKEVYQKASH